MARRVQERQAQARADGTAETARESFKLSAEEWPTVRDAVAALSGGPRTANTAQPRRPRVSGVPRHPTPPSRAPPRPPPPPPQPTAARRGSGFYRDIPSDEEDDEEAEEAAAAG